MLRQSHIDALRQQVVGHLDTAETMFFERELERIETTPYDVLYPELKARKIVPMGSGLGPADRFNTWRQFDFVGVAKEGSMDADNIPEVTLHGQETISTVVDILIGYSYSVQEIRESAKVQRPLDAMKASAARELIERKFEVMAANGSKDVTLNNIYGFLNQPNVPHIAVSTGTSSAGFTNFAVAAAGSTAANQTWNISSVLSKTPKEIIRDLNNAWSQVRSVTNGVHSPNKLVVDLKTYNYLNSTQINEADTAIFTEGTILSYIMKNLAWLQSVDWWLPCGAAMPQLDGSTFGGLGSTGSAATRAILYEDMPRNFKMFIPQEFEQFAPQLLNYKFKIPCHARFGGVVNYYPRSAVYLDGIGGA